MAKTKLMLKSADGRAVRFGGAGSYRNGVSSFVVENGDGTTSQVEEAIVAEGNDLFFSDDHVSKAFARIGLPCMQVRIGGSNSYSRLEVLAPEYSTWYHKNNYRVGYGSQNVSTWIDAHRFDRSDRRFGSREDWFSGKINGNDVSIEQFDAIYKVLTELGDYNGLTCGRYSHLVDESVYGGKSNVDMQGRLTIIGIGNVVTALSLSQGCAKGESRPKFTVGDAVTVKAGSGVISSISSDAITVQVGDKKVKSSFSQAERVKLSAVDLPDIDKSIANGFKFVMDNKNFLYHARLTVVDKISVPMFPCDDQRAQEYSNAMTCPCPICGWKMVKMKRYGEEDNYECCFCRQTAEFIGMRNDEIVLRMNRLPSKNSFALREAQCCGNCGNFHFETGRQGKRSTGYCSVANQCLQGFNVCDYWFPRTAETYTSNMRQHVTNLGYGVKDRRNTSRNDITDTIYCKEDHDLQKKRAEQAKAAYTMHYSKCMDNLLNAGLKLVIVDDKTDETKLAELKEHYSKVLAGGV